MWLNCRGLYCRCIILSLIYQLVLAKVIKVRYKIKSWNTNKKKSKDANKFKIQQEIRRKVQNALTHVEEVVAADALCCTAAKAVFSTTFLEEKTNNQMSIVYGHIHCSIGLLVKHFVGFGRWKQDKHYWMEYTK